jgi:succinoglycan biosynthesis protein ExoM
MLRQVVDTGPNVKRNVRKLETWSNSPIGCVAEKLVDFARLIPLPDAGPEPIRTPHMPGWRRDLMKIAVCALTYHRPVGLRRLLEGLDGLEHPEAAEVFIVIVDNDPGESGRAVVEAFAESAETDIEYAVEPTRGIWAGRNTAVERALERQADFVCFIDDDEWPEPDWLVQLMATQVATGADVVTGPVFPAFDEEPPQWILDGGFFDRPHFEHNERIPWATTSQVLLARRVFDDRPKPFDARFGLSGGDDTHFFAELRRAGYSMHWCELAHVHESIPVSRVDTGWLLRRQYRRGQTLSLSLRLSDPRASRYVRRIGNAIYQSLTGVGLLVVGLVKGRAVRMRGLEKLAFGAGLVTALAGRRYDEYTSTHGA